MILSRNERTCTMSDTPRPAERLRPHPTDRFAAPQIEVDLQAMIKRLRAEPGAGERGHRQETLYRRGGATIALFVFDRFTRLEEHKASGIVSMHVLRGRLKITAGGTAHDLRAGQMLITAPDVPHEIVAEEESEMLVNIHLGQQPGAPAAGAAAV
jgi:quercetin dioxygenase-like cupin family protein